MGAAPASGSLVISTSSANVTNSRSVGAPVMAGRVLGSSLQQQLDQLTEEDPDICCPVSLMVFTEPVIASDGFIYEKVSLTTLLHNRQSSPMTREVLRSSHRQAEEKLVEVQQFLEKRSRELLLFARLAAPSDQDLAVVALDRLSDYLEKLRSTSTPQLAKDAAKLYTSMQRRAPEGPVRKAAEKENHGSWLDGSWFNLANSFLRQ